MSPRRLLLAAALAAALAGAPDLASAKTILVPVTLVGGVPLPCGAERLGTCHNRWHFALHPVATAEPGDTLVFQTRDALDNQFNRASTAATVAAANLTRVHPLTGPVFVKGAKPGDVLAVTIEKIEPGPDRFGYTVIVPGFGFLRDVFPNPASVRWDLDSSGAVSRDMPGVRVPMNGFTGTIGVALGPGETRVAFQREEQLRLAGGFVLPPEPHDAVPVGICGVGGSFAGGPTPCLRTIPPRENGGNMDVKQMIAGTTLLFPCFVDGCLLSTGDVHFAQGDGEVSGTAIEMNAVVTVRVDVRKGRAALGFRLPEIEGKKIPRHRDSPARCFPRWEGRRRLGGRQRQADLPARGGEPHSPPFCYRSAEKRIESARLPVPRAEYERVSAHGSYAIPAVAGVQEEPADLRRQ